MRHLMKLDHIGYAVNDIATTARHYTEAGWTLSDIMEEPSQNVKVAFLTNDGFPTIELVMPSGNWKDPVTQVLRRSGVTPYHLCYEVDNIEQAMESLYEEGFIPLFAPVEAVAMQGHKICYMSSLEVGTIELVERVNEN